uniref:Ionotropic receptor 75b n=1 Tax=Bradysia odoriphaga TaxID=1564500 RepID=A0A6B9CES0_9DIPT|nr:ionotropic receptor 75b [Bradysia odoriphaga]
MKHIQRIALLLFFVGQLLEKVNCSNEGQVMNNVLISDYINANNLKICVLSSCNGNLELLNGFNDKSDTWYSFTNIAVQSVEFDTLFARFSHQIGVVVDLSCSQTVEFLREISKRMFFHRERYWLMFSPDMNRTEDVLQQLNVNADAEITVAIPVEDSARKNYRLYEAFNPSSTRGGLLNVTQIGTWTLIDGLNLALNKTKFENRRDFQGITFRGVVTIPKIPNHETFLQHLESVEFPHLNTISRFNYRIFQIMQQMFNFKIFLQRANSDGDLRNGRWQGAIGMINRREVDISVSGYRWKDEYYDAFEATVNSYATQPKFIFRHPKLVDSSTVFTEPFKNIVWVCIVVVCILSAYFLRHIFTAENHKKVKVNFGNESINDDSWSNSLLLILGILFQQGYSIEPLMISSRILTLSILVFSVLVSQFYSAFIVGSLLTEAPKSIKTVKQLGRSSLNFGIDDSAYILETFDQSNEDSVVKLRKRIMKNRDKNIMDLHEGLDLMKKGGFAFNTDVTSSYLKIKKMLTDDEICDLQDVVYVRETPTGPVVPKKSPLTEWIKISILKMGEAGILTYHAKIWIGTKPECPVRIVDFVPVDLLHFSTALYLIIFGIILSFLILLAEILVHSFQNSNREINTNAISMKWLTLRKFDNKLH